MVSAELAMPHCPSLPLSFVSWVRSPLPQASHPSRMPSPPRYWSPAFIEAFVEAMNDDADFMRATGSFTDTIILRCLDAPDGKDIEAAYVFEDGEVTDVELWIEDAPSQALRGEPFDKNVALARATAPYETWTKLDRGEISVMQAIASPDYNVEGNKLKILSHLGILNGMGAVAARLEKTY